MCLAASGHTYERKTVRKTIRLVHLIQDDEMDFIGVGEDGAAYVREMVKPDGEHVMGGKNRWVWKRMSMELHLDDVSADERPSDIPF